MRLHLFPEQLFLIRMAVKCIPFKSIHLNLRIDYNQLLVYCAIGIAFLQNCKVPIAGYGCIALATTSVLHSMSSWWNACGEQKQTDQTGYNKHILYFHSKDEQRVGPHHQEEHNHT
jgi:hypothetical protein